MEKTYTKDEVIEIIVQERIRAANICYNRAKREMENYESKKIAGNDMAFINKNIAEELRFAGNAISGRNGLNVNIPIEKVISNAITKTGF